MNGEINGTFIYNGKPQNGATAKCWKITGFASYATSGDTVQDNPLAAASIELNVTSGAAFAVGDIIKIESELLRIWAIATNLLYVIRGYRGTTAASHVQTTVIYDETVSEPAQDAAEPNVSYQQGATLTTGVSCGGDGAYRGRGVPGGEYYVSVYYDNHYAWLYSFIENNDATPDQVLTTRGDILIRGASGSKRLAKGAAGQVLTQGADEAAWAASSVASGTYTGDSTVNRAIVHGLGRTPKIVFLINVDGSIWFRIFGAYAFVLYSYVNVTGSQAVTIPDATNFYVGNAADYALSANYPYLYYWVAIG